MLKNGKIKATFIAMLLATTFIAPLISKASAAPEIAYINPYRGPAGTIVRIIGTIDTSGGSYEILWDWVTVLKEGNCPPGSNQVNDTFTVPSSSEGVHNITLFDIESEMESDPVQFLVTTLSYALSIEPARIQEGFNTTITVSVQGAETNKNYIFTMNVTTPTNASYVADLTIATDEIGFGNGSKIFWGEFPGANTNFVGTYSVAVNETLATGNFTVGLTDRLIYGVNETVHIQGSGYQPYENVTVNIKFGEESVEGYPKNITANMEGVAIDSWLIPINATTGTYMVTLVGATTTKEPPDEQEFSIRVICQIQTKKLDGEALAGVEVWVYNATMWAVNASLTDEEGLAEFWLEVGNYTFEAYWGEPGRRILVGTLVNMSIMENVTLTLWCWIARLRVAISPPLPFVDITLTYQNMTKTYVTNSTGIWELGDTPTNISYTIEARRYGLSFYNETLEKLPAAMNVSWINITITCPAYTLFVHVLDSKGLPIQNVTVAVYEWTSGVTMPTESGVTDDLGSVTLTCLFGKYKVRVYNQDRTIILNETAIDLTEDQLFLVVYCKIFNVDLSVAVKDYFGNSIPSALVKIERENIVLEQKTDLNGKTSFKNITGGEIQISISVNGKLCETRTIYLDETRMEVFKLERYVMVAGHLLEVTQFTASILLGLLVILFAIALIYGRLRPRKVSEGKEKSL